MLAKVSVIMVGMLARFAEAVRLCVLRGPAIHIACTSVLGQKGDAQDSCQAKSMPICMHTQT